MKAHAITDVGRTRDHNEDSFGEDADLGLWVVADGMGGHAAGEIASDLAVSHIFRMVAEGTPAAEAVSRAHDLIRRAPSQGIGSAGMGTTVVLALLSGSSYCVCWVGDSRAYVYGSDGLMQITVDHSYVQHLVDSGAITTDEAEVHPERSVVTHCLGADTITEIQVDEVVGELYNGDVLLLCTDGLTGEVRDADIAAVLREEIPISEKAQRLVDEANANGGSDNITVALIPAPADARPKHPDARTREIRSIATRRVPAVRRRRGSVWRTSVAAAIAAAIAAASLIAWFGRDYLTDVASSLIDRGGEPVPPANPNGGGGGGGGDETELDKSPSDILEDQEAEKGGDADDLVGAAVPQPLEAAPNEAVDKKSIDLGDERVPPEPDPDTLSGPNSDASQGASESEDPGA